MSPIGTSGLGVDMDLEGLQASTAMLQEIADRGVDMRPALKMVKEVLAEGNQRQFSSRGSYLDEPWPALSPETQRRKAREGVPSLTDTLVASGDLQASLDGGRDSIGRVTRTSVRVGTKLFYARFAQSGASGSRRGTEPKRPMIGIGRSEQEASEHILIDYLTGVRS